MERPFLLLLQSQNFTLPAEATISYFRWLFTSSDSLFHLSPGTLKYALDFFDTSGNFVLRLDSIVLSDTLTHLSGQSRDVVIQRLSSQRGFVRLRRVSSGLVADGTKWRTIITRQRMSDAVGGKRGRGFKASDAFALSASPNPFKSTIEFTFKVPKSGTVSLEVFDVLGRRMDVIADREFRAGTHKLRWNALDLPNGSYMIKLRQGMSVAIENITLMK